MASLPAVSQAMPVEQIRYLLESWQARITLKNVGRGHHYVVDGAKKGVASVTTLMGCRVSPRLIDWSSRVQFEADAEVAWRIAAGIGDFFQGGPAVLRGIDATPETHDAFIARFKEVSGAERENARQLREAGELGVQVHALIEWLLKSRLGLAMPEPTVPDRALAVFGDFEAWAESVALEPVALESRIFHVALNYGGTIDALAYATLPTKARRLYVFDWKTSKGIYPEMRLQSGAYRAALIDMGLPEAGGLLIHLPKEGDGVGTVQVVEVEEPLDELMDAFLAHKKLHAFFGRYR